MFNLTPFFKIIFTIITFILVSSCATYRPLHVEFSDLHGTNVQMNSDSVSVWAYPIHPDTSDLLFDYGNWFLGYYPPKATDNILHKGYQPYYLNIQNNSRNSLGYTSKDQSNFITGKTFHKKTRIKHWLIFGISTGISAGLAIIQPAFFLPFFGTVFAGYTLPSLFYNLGLSGKRKEYLQNLSPSELQIPSNKTDSIIVFAPISNEPLTFRLKSSAGSYIDIPVKPSDYRSRFFKFNGLNAMKMRAGDSITVIGEKLDISPVYLLAFNDLLATEKIMIGDTFYLEPKRKYSIEKNHIVKEGDNLFKISQKYGINKESLYNLNKDQNVDSLYTGQMLRLNNQK